MKTERKSQHHRRTILDIFGRGRNINKVFLLIFIQNLTLGIAKKLNFFFTFIQRITKFKINFCQEVSLKY